MNSNQTHPTRLVISKGNASTATSMLIATDFESLSVFRVVFATYLLVDYMTGVYPWFDVFFGEAGVMPFSALASNPEIPVAVAISWVFEAIRLPLILPLLYPVALFSFAAGYRTRLSNAVVFILNSYLYWRNPYILSGAEILAKLLLLWCMFLPMSRAWSIDAALDPKPRDRPYPALPFVALRLQITSLYFFGGIFKLGGSAWRDGSAISMVLRDNLFGGTPIGLSLADHFPILLKNVTYATIAFQLVVPFLIYSPRYNNWTRGFALAGLVAMHLSFIVFLNIDQFPFLCLGVLTLLVPDAWWDAVLRRRRARLARIAIFYDPDCGFCRRLSLLLRELLLTPGATVLPAYTDPQALSLLSEHNSWVVRGADGGIYLKWRAVAYVLKQSPLFAPLGWLTDLPALRPAAARLYGLIGSHRRRLGSIAACIFPLRSEPSLGTPGKILCGALMGLALACNIVSVPGKGAGPTPGQLFVALQIWQSWALFAPNPPSFQRQFFVWAQGKLLNATSRVVGQAKRFSKEVARGTKRARNDLQRLVLEGRRQELDAMVPLVKQEMKQTRARIFRGDTHADTQPVQRILFAGIERPFLVDPFLPKPHRPISAQRSYA